MAAWLETAGKPGCLSQALHGTCVQADGSHFTEPKVPHSNFAAIPSMERSDPTNAQSEHFSEFLPKTLACS